MKHPRISIPKSEVELHFLIQQTVELTTTSVLEQLGLLKPYLSLNECYRRYGEGTVNRWLNEGLIRKIKDGEGNSPVRIKRTEIETVSNASNRCEWYMNNRTIDNKEN